MNKKVIWILLLVAVVIGIVLAVIFIKPKDNTNNNVSIGNRTVDNSLYDPSYENVYNTMEANSNAKGVDESKLSSYQKTQLDDGVLYSKDGKQVEADKIIGDEYYDTTINDMWLNYDSYKGKKIQIEGMFLKNSGLTFVGRYSTSSLCANCPAGYSVMEYQLDGTIDQELINEKSWIKIVATLEKGNDEGSSMEYLYLKVITLEVMNESGKKTVSN